MKVWICNGCHAEITSVKRPDACTLCSEKRGFYEAEMPDVKKDSHMQKAAEELKKYDEGTQPEKLVYSGFKDEE